MAILPVDLVETFNGINVNNFGPTMAYLTLVYLKNIPEMEITSWLVSAYDFYSRVVKDRGRVSLAILHNE